MFDRALERFAVPEQIQGRLQGVRAKGGDDSPPQDFEKVPGI